MVDTTTYGLHYLKYTAGTIWNGIHKMIGNLAEMNIL